jgi:hypothetical protein
MHSTFHSSIIGTFYLLFNICSLYYLYYSKVITLNITLNILNSFLEFKTYLLRLPDNFTLSFKPFKVQQFINQCHHVVTIISFELLIICLVLLTNFMVTL